MVLTIAFILLSSVLIYVPSIAYFRLQYLNTKIAGAQIASLAVEAAQDNTVPVYLEAELLTNADVLAVALRRRIRAEIARDAGHLIAAHGLRALDPYGAQVLSLPSRALVTAVLERLPRPGLEPETTPLARSGVRPKRPHRARDGRPTGD